MQTPKEARARFERISSEHIYSLHPSASASASASASTSSSSSAAALSASLVATQVALHTTAKYAKAWEGAERGTRLGALRNAGVEDLLVSPSGCLRACREEN